MIRRLHVQGWRAFEDLSLDLDDGLTFVVAENGVGKTSLVQAAAWGMFGELSRVDAKAARRAGESVASVTLEVELGDGRVSTVRRAHDGKSESFEAWVDGSHVDEDTLAKTLAESFGASREFLSRTTILPSDNVADERVGSFALHAHLCHVFGVDQLIAAADRLDDLHRAAEAAAKKHRQESRRVSRDLVALRTELADVEQSADQATAEWESAKANVAAAESSLREAQAAEAARARAATARAAFDELRVAAQQLLGARKLATDVSALAERLEAEERAATDDLDERRRSLANIEGRLEALRAAAAELQAASAECPVCRRPLTDEDMDHASRQHAQDISALLAQAQDARQAADAAAARAIAVRDLTRRVAKTPQIEPLPAIHDLDAVSADVESSRERFEQASDNLAAVRARRSALATQISDEEAFARDTEAAYLAHRREATTNIAARVTRAVANRILTERIEPLAVELAHRWKRVFTARGALQLLPNGSLVLRRGIHDIPFDQFSSGEKVVALLAVRVLVLSASTRASFLWLDEPLEHLDPKNRRLAASLMNIAGAHVRQVLVTTYEERLARRLSANGAAHLRYVRAADRL